MEKISFVYATRILPGMVANVVHPPESIFFANSFPESISFYAYAGLILQRDAAYSINVDVFHDGLSLLAGEHSVTRSESYNVATTKKGDFISTSATWMSGVKFPCEGEYEIKVTLFKGTVEDASNDPIDQHSSFIILRQTEKGV